MQLSVKMFCVSMTFEEHSNFFCFVLFCLCVCFFFACYFFKFHHDLKMIFVY